MTENNTIEMTAAEMLRNARTTGRRKREIGTIAKQLCIREEFLEALENGDYHKIPELVYVLGFARNYAMELGLEPEEIITKIKREMGLTPDDAAGAESADAADVVPMVKSGTRWVVRGMNYVKKHWMWFIAGVIVLAVAAVSIVLTVRSGARPASMPEVIAPAPVVAPADSAPVYNLAVRERFGTENADNSEIVLQANQESWIKVEDARGNNVFSRVLVPGDIYYVPAGGRHKATFGNAGGVDVWVNGKQAPRVGPDHTRKAGIVLSPANLMPAAPVAQ